jgi:hypothetical protein
MAMVSLLAFQRWIYQWLWVLVEDQTLLLHTVLFEEKKNEQPNGSSILDGGRAIASSLAFLCNYMVGIGGWLSGS